MTHADFSITYNFLDTLAAYNEKVGVINSFFVVHIGGAITVGCTAIIDTLWHLAAGVTKVATGFFATPIAYFTNSNSAKEWAWSTAGKHLLQATNHAFGFFVSAPTTFFFSPKAALDVLFPQKVKLDELQVDYRKLEQKYTTSNSENNRYGSINRECQNKIHTLQQTINQKDRSNLNIISNLEMKLINAKNEVDLLKIKLESQPIKNNFSVLSNVDANAIESLKFQMSKKENELLLLRSDYENMKNTNDNENLKLINRIKKNESENNDLSVKLQRESTKVQELQKNVSDLEQKLRNEVSDHKLCINKVEVLEQKITILESQLSDKIIEIFEMTARNEKMNRAIENEGNERKLAVKELNDQKLVINELTQNLLQAQMITHNFKGDNDPSKIPKGLVDLINGLAAEIVCPMDLELLKNGNRFSPCEHHYNHHDEVGDDIYSPKIGGECPSCRTKIEGFQEDAFVRKVASKIEEIGTFLNVNGKILESYQSEEIIKNYIR